MIFSFLADVGNGERPVQKLSSPFHVSFSPLYRTKQQRGALEANSRGAFGLLLAFFCLVRTLAGGWSFLAWFPLLSK